MQRQLQAKMRIIYVLGFGASYIRFYGISYKVSVLILAKSSAVLDIWPFLK